MTDRGTASANQNQAVHFTAEELTEFAALMELLGHRFPLVRVIAELDLKDFVWAHGTIKCEAMARAINRKKGH